MREGGNFLSRETIERLGGKPWDDFESYPSFKTAIVSVPIGVQFPWELSGDKPRRVKRKPRKPTLAAALKEADKAGRPVRSAVIAPSGEFTLQFGEPETPTTNPWDAATERLTKQ
jgi:hypothetical protein